MKTLILGFGLGMIVAGNRFIRLPQETREPYYWPVIDLDSTVSYTYDGRLVRVIDGDTVVLEIDSGFEHWLHNQRMRLYGVESTEPNSANRLLVSFISTGRARLCRY